MIIKGKPTIKFENKEMTGFEVCYCNILVLKIDNGISKPHHIRFHINDFYGNHKERIIDKLTQEDPLFHFINSIYHVTGFGSKKSKMENLSVDTIISYITSLKEIEIDCDLYNDPQIFKVISIEEGEFKMEDLLPFPFY